MGWEDRAYNKDDSGGGVPPVSFSLPRITPLTATLIGVCLLVYLAQAFTRSMGSPLTRWGDLTFLDASGWKQPWRFITYQYLHGSAGHFFFNMVGLYFFLPTLERMWGWRKAFAFYTAGGVVAGLVYALLSAFIPNPGLVGASGSIFAVLGAVALLSPQTQIILVFFMVPIRVAAALFAAFFLLSAVADNDLSDAAHLGGLAFGFFAPWFAGPALSRWNASMKAGRVARTRRAQVDEQREIDRILQKVHTAGMNSLSRGERKALARATERQRQADLARAARSR
jgi:rhomboid family protein